MCQLKYVVLLSVFVCSTVYSQSKPWFCQTRDCPLFNTEVANGGIEKRTYPEESRWVGTSATSASNSLSWRQQGTMFWKLFRYINGTNSQNLKIDMTVPVLVKFEKTGGRRYEVTMLFYLAVPNPPTPTDPTVFLHTVAPSSIFFVQSYRTFFMIDWAWNSQLENLRSKAVENGMAYNEAVFYKAGYNKPSDFNQHKEIWLEAL